MVHEEGEKATPGGSGNQQSVTALACGNMRRRAVECNGLKVAAKETVAALMGTVTATAMAIAGGGSGGGGGGGGSHVFHKYSLMIQVRVNPN